MIGDMAGVEANLPEELEAIRVFVVDDHGMVRRGVRSYLSIFDDIEVIGEAANGRDALLSNTTGGSNVADGLSALSSNTSGGANTATGREALSSNTTSNFNTAYGYQALSSNTT